MRDADPLPAVARRGDQAAAACGMRGVVSSGGAVLRRPVRAQRRPRRCERVAQGELEDVSRRRFRSAGRRLGGLRRAPQGLLPRAQRPGQRPHGVAGGDRTAFTGSRREAPGHIPGRVSPRPRAADQEAAPGPHPLDARRRLGGEAPRRHMLRRRRPLQHARARYVEPHPAGEARRPPRDERRRRRRREPRVPDAAGVGITGERLEDEGRARLRAAGPRLLGTCDSSPFMGRWRAKPHGGPGQILSFGSTAVFVTSTSTRATASVTLSGAPSSRHRSITRSAPRSRLPSLSSSLPISSTLTPAVSTPSLHSTTASPSSSFILSVNGCTCSHTPTARVSLCFCGWLAASSGLINPRRTCSAGHEWSCEMSFANPLRKRYAGLSPTLSTAISPERMAAITIVLPMPNQSGLSCAALNTALLASLHARFRRSTSGPSSPSSARTLVTVCTARELASWPAAWPPIPSQTTISVLSPALFRHTATESSFSSRSSPGSVAHAMRSRNCYLPSRTGIRLR